ncbi:MAG TPA: M48 family metallopeptidase [Candidatus Nanoarchaeia archaeon]|nr:M48 family metallopeptidase [Candidatus Nanoarchaeia archaeon]
MKTNKSSFYDEINHNKRDSVLLIIFVMASLVSISWFIGWVYDPSIASFAIIIGVFVAITSTYYSYYNSDKIVLATMNSVESTQGKTSNLLEGLCIGAGMPKPRLYIIKSDDINAFATGRDPSHAIIGVTQGAIDKLDRDELEGVLAHELSHIRNYDIRFMTIVATLVGMIVIISEVFRHSLWYGSSSRDSKGKSGAIILIIGLLFAILAPIIMQLIRLSISRKREYLADASGAQISRNPDGLANALEKIKEHNNGRMRVSKAVSHLFIANPFKNTETLLSTHPPIEQRIEKLRNM